eukprot:m51a1_g8603 hypothetical protein (717) ;mRNA; f:186493-188783
MTAELAVLVTSGPSVAYSGQQPFPGGPDAPVWETFRASIALGDRSPPTTTVSLTLFLRDPQAQESEPLLCQGKAHFSDLPWGRRCSVGLTLGTDGTRWGDVVFFVEAGPMEEDPQQLQTRQSRYLSVLVGINKLRRRAGTGGEHDLQGAVNDVSLMQLWTAASRRSPDDERVLLQGDATRQRIVQSLEWMQNEARRGDSLLFFFSGLGTTHTVPQGSEALGIPARATACLCPADVFAEAKPNYRLLSSVDVAELLQPALARGATVTLVLDCSFTDDDNHDPVSDAEQEPGSPGHDDDSTTEEDDGPTDAEDEGQGGHGSPGFWPDNDPYWGRAARELRRRHLRVMDSTIEVVEDKISDDEHMVDGDNEETEHMAVDDDWEEQMEEPDPEEEERSRRRVFGSQRRVKHQPLPTSVPEAAKMTVVINDFATVVDILNGFVPGAQLNYVTRERPKGRSVAEPQARDTVSVGSVLDTMRVGAVQCAAAGPEEDARWVDIARGAQGFGAGIAEAAKKASATRDVALDRAALQALEGMTREQWAAVARQAIELEPRGMGEVVDSVAGGLDASPARRRLLLRSLSDAALDSTLLSLYAGISARGWASREPTVALTFPGDRDSHRHALRGLKSLQKLELIETLQDNGDSREKRRLDEWEPWVGVLIQMLAQAPDVARSVLSNEIAQSGLDNSGYCTMLEAIAYSSAARAIVAILEASSHRIMLC